MKIEKSTTTSKNGKTRTIIKLHGADGWSKTKVDLVTKLLQLLPYNDAPINERWADLRALIRDMEAAGLEQDVLAALGGDEP